MMGETIYYRPQAMYCRRRAKEGAFGHFVYSEGEYFHDVDKKLREVRRMRSASAAGQEWEKKQKLKYVEAGIKDGPMHYPTHSTCGPMCVMGAHAVKVSALGFIHRNGDRFFEDYAFSKETAFFKMSNGATMRICEFREVGHTGREMFRIYGTEGSFENDKWLEDLSEKPLTVEEMRDPLPDEVVEAYKTTSLKSDFYGGHGGSHAYLAHEFVDAIAHERAPAVNAWEAVRYMAAGVAAHRSALKDGEWLDVVDWGDAPA